MVGLTVYQSTLLIHSRSQECCQSIPKMGNPIKMGQSIQVELRYANLPLSTQAPDESDSFADSVCNSGVTATDEASRWNLVFTSLGTCSEISPAEI